MSRACSEAVLDQNTSEMPAVVMAVQVVLPGCYLPGTVRELLGEERQELGGE